MTSLSGRLLSVVALVGLPGLSASGGMTFDFSLPGDDYRLQEYGGFELPVCNWGGVGFEDGQPNLPVVSLCFVIPTGSVVTGAALEILSERGIPGFHDILPVRTTPVGAAPGPFVRDPVVYLSDDAFPSSQVVATSTGTRTGFQLGTVAFTPFRYNPLSGRLFVIESARIAIEYMEDASTPVPALTARQVENAADILEHIVRNPSDLEVYRPPLHSPSEVVEWVAVGAASMESVLEPLVEMRNSMGLSAEYVTLEWICSNYDGYDTQERIRNFLIDAYLDRGLMYVLLVGDWGETQRVSSLRIGGDSLLLGETTDLYYSDLTRTWDGDGDHLYGENSDWIDYYSDIAAGRFSSDNPNHVATQVQKTMEYETESPEGAWRTTALLCGAGLWPDVEPDGYWGSFVCDSISGLIPPDWTQHKLYEYWEGHPTNQIDLVNAGASYVSDQGHGGSSGVYWLYEPSNMFTNANYTGMQNGGMLPIFHSMACNPGQLSVNGCSAERLMMWPYGGAIAVMYNSNYGWGTPPAMGPSEHLELHFANMLFVNGVQRIGDMQAAAKDAFKAWGSQACQNWVLQENNMLGDPATLFPAYQTGTGDSGSPPAPGACLIGVSPNPSTGAVAVYLSLPAPCPVALAVYDLSGRMVQRAGSVDLPAGQNMLSWDGRGTGGMPLAGGVYLMRVFSGQWSDDTMVVLME